MSLHIPTSNSSFRKLINVTSMTGLRLFILCVKGTLRGADADPPRVLTYWPTRRQLFATIPRVNVFFEAVIADFKAISRCFPKGCIMQMPCLLSLLEGNGRHLQGLNVRPNMRCLRHRVAQQEWSVFYLLLFASHNLLTSFNILL